MYSNARFQLRVVNMYVILYFTRALLFGAIRLQRVFLNPGLQKTQMFFFTCLRSTNIFSGVLKIESNRSSVLVGDNFGYYHRYSERKTIAVLLSLAVFVSLGLNAILNQ